MIQRIQTLLFFIAAVCFAAACFMPVGTITTLDAHYVVTPWVLKENIPDGAIMHPTYFIGLLQGLLAIISCVAIFLYKNRSMQSKFCIAAIFINFILIILMLWVYPEVVFAKFPQIDYSLWSMLSILPVACFYFANKFIIKDEKKVRAADRLR